MPRKDMPRKDRPTDPVEIQRSIEEAIQDLVRKGWLSTPAKGDGLNGPAAMKSCGSLKFSARRSSELPGRAIAKRNEAR
jgi:hypothetical protein